MRRRVLGASCCAICRRATDPVLGSSARAAGRSLEPLFVPRVRVIRGCSPRDRAVSGLANLPANGAYHHQPEPSELSRSVSRSAECCRFAPCATCSSSARPSTSRRRSCVAGAPVQPRPRRSGREPGAGDESRRVRPGARQDPDAVPRRRAVDRRHGQTLQEGRADPVAAARRADRPGRVEGAYEIWPRNRSINWSVLWPWSRHRVRIAFGRPMQFRGESYAEAPASRRRSCARNVAAALIVR